MGATMGKSGGNFLDGLPAQGTLHVVMLGLDSAGKTTALYRLKFDQYLNTVPTIGFNCEKVQGTVGKAKGVQFLVWDVGGQEKLRPLWRSYTRCTDGILFVVDSVDVERMEEAKMELMRTAKCPDNQGVPVLILANKQDLPRARDPKELEKLLGLHELLYPTINITSISSGSSSTDNIVGNSCSGNKKSSDPSCSSSCSHNLTPTSQTSKSFIYNVSMSNNSLSKEFNTQIPASSTSSLMDSYSHDDSVLASCETSQSCHQKPDNSTTFDSISASVATTPTSAPQSSLFAKKPAITTGTTHVQFKGWYIQPACAITGEGLQEGLEALYEMILKRRKFNKANKKKR